MTEVRRKQIIDAYNNDTGSNEYYDNTVITVIKGTQKPVWHNMTNTIVVGIDWLPA